MLPTCNVNLNAFYCRDNTGQDVGIFQPSGHSGLLIASIARGAMCWLEKVLEGSFRGQPLQHHVASFFILPCIDFGSCNIFIIFVFFSVSAEREPYRRPRSVVGKWV